MEKNPTIVNFPIHGVTLGELVPDDLLDKEKSAKYNLLVNISHQGQPPLDASVSTQERRAAAIAASATTTSSDANTANTASKIRPTQAQSGSYQVHLHHHGTDQWYRIQDLMIEPIMPQMIFLSESYIQIWERGN